MTGINASWYQGNRLEAVHIGMPEHFAVHEQTGNSLSPQRQTTLLQLESNHIDLKSGLSGE